jgi:hypothetical protein
MLTRCADDGRLPRCRRLVRPVDFLWGTVPSGHGVTWHLSGEAHEIGSQQEVGEGPQ